MEEYTAPEVGDVGRVVKVTGKLSSPSNLSQHKQAKDQVRNIVNIL